MTMILRWALLAALGLLTLDTAGAAEKRYGLTSFEAIEVNANVLVEVTARSPVGAVVSGPQEVLDRLTIEVRDGRLAIGETQFAGDERRAASHGPITIRVNAANLRAAALAGTGSLDIDRLAGSRVVISLRGPGRLAVGRVEADLLSVAMIGNGTLMVGGQAKRAQMMLSGAGVVDAGDLRVAELISDSEGAGDHRLHAVKSATVTARGIGRTVVLGRPACTVRNIGSGTVECGAGK